MTDERLLTLSEIAELTGFAVPTVSNWIRRFDDFPDGHIVNGSKRPRYNAEEVLSWLEHRRLSRDASEEHSALLSIDRERRRDFLGTLFAVLHSLPDRKNAPIEQVMRKYEELVSAQEDSLLNFDLSEVPDIVSVLASRYKGFSDVELARILSEVDAGPQSRSGGEHTTPEVLVDFIGALAAPTNGAVLDLASGQGGLLEHLASKGIGETHVGRDVNRTAIVRARQHALLRGLGISYSVASGIGPVEAGSCALVVVDPPLGQKMARKEIDDASWPFAKPSQQDMTTAFLQRAIEAVEPGGAALVLTAAALLQRGGEVSELRRQLLIAGVIRAVVALPPRLRANTAIPLALWILGPPNPTAEGVVMVDASLSSPEDLAANGPVVAAILAELNQDTLKQNAEYATTVPIRELLTRDVALRPNAWVAKKRDLIEPQEQLVIARSGLDSITGLIGPLSVTSRDLGIGEVEPSLVSLEDLQSRRAIKIFRSASARAVVDGTGAPILDARVLNGGKDKESAKRVADDSSRGLKVEPGDVVVAAGSRAVMAKVWREEGWVAGPSIQVIRPNPSEIDAYFLATAIEHSRNHAHVDPGALKVQVNIRGFEVPELSIDQQRGLSGLIRALDDAETELHTRLEHLSSAKLSVLQAVGSGTLLTDQTANPPGITK